MVDCAPREVFTGRTLKNGLGTTCERYGVPSDSCSGVRKLCDLLTCSSRVWLPTYDASSRRPGHNSYSIPAEYCHTFGIVRRGSLNVTLSPTCVANPRLDPGGWMRPFGNGFA